MTPRGQGSPRAPAAVPARSFTAEMTCCKTARVHVGLACERPYQMGCAFHQVERMAAAGGERALAALQAFAAHLLGDCAWPLAQVFWVFQAGWQLSALAQVCAWRWRSISTKEGRASYTAEVAAATTVYRVEIRAHTTAAFLMTFHVLCEAAIERP